MLLKKMLFLVVLCLLVPMFLIAEGKSEKNAADEVGAQPVREITVLSLTANYSPERFEMMRRLEEIWENELGLEVNRVVMDYNALMDRAMGEQHDYDMVILHWGATAVRTDPDVFLYQFHHSSMDKPFAYNVVGYHNDQYDSVVEETRRYYDLEKRQELVYEAQKILYEDQPRTPFIFDEVLFCWNSDRWADPNNYHNDIGMGIAGFWFQWGAEPKTSDEYLKLAYPRPLKILNPLFATQKFDLQAIRNVYDTLMKVGPKGKVQNWAAKKVERIDDTTLKITLRDDLKFHDGEKLTAEDVKFTFDFMKKYEALNYASALKEIESVEANNDLELTIYLNRPFAPIYVTVFSQMPLLPKHIWTEVENEWDDPKNFPNENPIGSGPYKWVSWKKGSEFKMDRFEDHFNPAKPGGLLYLIYGSTDAMVGAVEAKEADAVIMYILPFQFKRLTELDYISGEPLLLHGFFDLWYNCRREPFDDVSFRNAMAHTIPAKQFIQDIFEGYGNHESAMIGSANDFWHNPNLPPIPYDIEEAKKILNEAGYTYNSEGLLCYPE
jgi:peptide/nickel transport system substrate-binding protein